MPERVLVVDDEPDDLRLLQTYLERAGYELCPVRNVEEALAAASEQRPDLIILDWAHAGPGGATTLARLKDGEGLGDVPVMVLVPVGDAAGQAHAVWDGGADCLLSKPFNGEELLSFARRLVASRP